MSLDQVVSMKSLLEAGVHFGHRTRRWNPKMKPYIFTERNGIHIIDLQQTIKRLDDAYELVKNTVSSGGVVLFVGTKKQAQESLSQEAARCGMPYVNQRWLGGTLTNWRTIRQRIDYMLEIERQQARGEFARLTKKEALMREREIARLNHRLGGLKEMRRLPNLLFVVDVRRDAIAVKEANILGIPIIAMVDTNCDPDPIDHIIPSNDDAIRALKLMNSTMASAVLEGQAILSSMRAEEEEVAGLEEEEVMERYLGPSTLAKLQAEQSEDDDEEEADVVVEEEAEAELDEAAEVVANALADNSDAVDEPSVEADSEENSSQEVVEEATEKA
ncbi:MAG: 30S ribosomal protein S2 [Anaerolineae bacterium]|nr:30S ribosomal protein S2 [Anaerolineae bacterium]